MVRVFASPFVFGFVALAAVSGCGGSQKEIDSAHLFPDEGLHEDSTSNPPSEMVAAPVTDLARPKVSATVDAGFGRFLQGVEVEASVIEGKFQGFRIVRFVHPEDWQGVGLLPGDVVTRVNEQPIERPEQAYAVFASLKTAKSVDVAYTRDGHPMRLSLPILEAPPAPVAPATPAAVAPPTAPAPTGKPATPLVNPPK